ncbi:MAG: GreA/GreB family elongation factor [Cytophagaceae bacterium]|nr:GreA/GreB family elongation factor [Cytophagaceae bacterium]
MAENSLKKQVFDQLKTTVDGRMQAAWDAMQDAQASANEESKSSAGDKYETARAMGQLDRDMYARQYEQARQERQILDRMDEATFPRIGLGALVSTSVGWFAVSVSAGAMTVSGQKIIAVSPQSPIGALLMGKQVGETFVFGGKSAAVLEIG